MNAETVGRESKSLELENSKKSWREWLLPVAAALLCMLLLQNIFARKFVPVADIAPVDGVLDITGIDFSQTVFQVSNNWDFYPGALWDSADFAAGRVGEKAGQEVSASDTACGTYRLRILAEPNQYYTICSFSLDYASRVFVNGSEVAVFGKVSESADDFVPQVGYMTIPLFSGPDGEIEIIYQYANYFHDQGGYIPPGCSANWIFFAWLFAAWLWRCGTRTFTISTCCRRICPGM